METNNKKKLNIKLSSLINDYSNSTVVQEIERNINQGKSTQLLTKDVDDNYLFKSIPFLDSLFEKEYEQIKKGHVQPIVVRPKKNYYEVVLGRRTLLTSKKHEILTIQAVITNLSDEETLLLELNENINQKDFNIIERAALLKELCDKYNYNQETLAKFTHQSRPQITNILRLLNLPQQIINDIALNKLNYGHAKAIASLSQTNIEKLVNQIYENKLSVRELEYIVKTQYKNKKEELEKILGKYNVLINEKDNNVNITFSTLEEKNEFIKEIKK